MSTVKHSEDMLSAITQGRFDAVKAALEGGADVEFTRSDSTPLMLAASRGDLAIVEALLERHADPRRGNSIQWTAFHEAAREGHTEVALLIASRMGTLNLLDSDGWTGLRAAISGKRSDTALALLEQGALAGGQDYEGVSPLMAAVERRLLPVVKSLLSRGADATAQDFEGKSVVDRCEGWPEGQDALRSIKPAAFDQPATITPASETSMVNVSQVLAAEEPQVSALGMSRITKRTRGPA